MNTPFTRSLAFEEAGQYLKSQFCSFGLDPYVDGKNSVSVMLRGAMRRKELKFSETTQEIDLESLRKWVELNAREALIQISFAITHEAIGEKNYEQRCFAFAEHMENTGLFTKEVARKYCTPFRRQGA